MVDEALSKEEIVKSFLIVLTVLYGLSGVYWLTLPVRAVEQDAVFEIASVHLEPLLPQLPDRPVRPFYRVELAGDKVEIYGSQIESVRAEPTAPFDRVVRRGYRRFGLVFFRYQLVLKSVPAVAEYAAYKAAFPY